MTTRYDPAPTAIVEQAEALLTCSRPDLAGAGYGAAGEGRRHGVHGDGLELRMPG